MIDPPFLPLEIVDATALPEVYRQALRPGETMVDARGQLRLLPRYFFEVPSWEVALKLQLTTHFGLWELIDVDVRETGVLRRFPRYVPCAITVLAAHLQLFRSEVGRVVRIAANGGYRSPSHRFAGDASPHCWGSAANIYRIGDDSMVGRDAIEQYRTILRGTLRGAWTRPFGVSPGYAFDHLHLDLGYVTVDPGPGSGESTGEDRGIR